MQFKKSVQKEREYPLTKGEIKYKIFFNPDKEKYSELRKKIVDNFFFCPSKEEKSSDTRCMCKEFRNLDKENEYCSCGLYFKRARTETEIKEFITSKKIISKNEKQILKEELPQEDSNLEAS